jgi:hypothetical protein
MNRKFYQRFLIILIIAGLLADCMPQPTPIAAPLASAVAVKPAPIQAIRSADVAAKPIVSTSLNPSSTQAPVNMNSAYARDLDLGNGDRAVMLAQTPINYQDERGDWHPIDPRFDPTAAGFANSRNSIDILAANNRAAFRLTKDDLTVGWQALGLIADPSGKNSVYLGQPITRSTILTGSLSSDGRTITYADSWTLPGLSDQIVADSGQVEHDLIFAQAPAFPKTAAQLTLRARLRIVGGQLYVGGKAQTGAFDTIDALEIRDAQGHAALTLSPARIFERAQPANGLSARYHVEPYDATDWVISMETPAQWWTAIERQYPIVWDPAFAIVKPTEIADVTQLPAQNDGNWLPYSGLFKAGLGQNGSRGMVKTFIRFNNLNQLTFPPGYQIQRAQFVIAPDDGWFNTVNGVNTGANVLIDLHAVSGAWNPNTVNWPGPAYDASPLCSRMYLTVYPPGSPAATQPNVTFCDIQNGDSGIVSQWLRGQRTNNGLMLKLSSNVSGQDAQGHHFVFIPKTSSWSVGAGGYTYDPALTGRGVALIIHYRGPQLHDGQPLLVALPVQDGGDYLRTGHAWRVGDDLYNKTWQAVVVKAVRAEVQSGQNVLLKRENMAIEAGCDGMNLICTNRLSPRKDDNIDWESGANFVIGQNLYGTGKEIRVPAVLPANPQATGYLVEAVGSVNAPAFPGEDYGSGLQPGTGVITIAFSMSTTHSLKLFNLTTSPNTRLRVSVNTSEYAGAVHLFKPQSISYVKNDDSRDPAMPNTPKTRAVLPNEAGIWAVAFEWTGDAAYMYDPGLRANAPNSPATPIYVDSIDVQIVIRSCPLDARPVADGCEFMQKPDGSTPSRKVYVNNGPDYFLVYSLNDFDPCPVGPVTCWLTHRPSVGKKYMPWITWNGDKGRMVGVSGHTIKLDTDSGSPVLSNNPFDVASNDSAVLLALDPPGAVTQTLDMWTGSYTGIFSGGQAGFLERAYPGNIEQPCNSECDNLPLNEPYPYTDLTKTYARIDVRNGGAFAQHAEYSTVFNRPLLSGSSLITPSFSVAWSINIQTSVEGKLVPYNLTVLPLSGTGLQDVASMSLNMNQGTWGIVFNQSSQKFTDLTSTNARIQQSNSLGGAWDFVRGVILPAGLGPTGEARLCTGYCVTVRANDGNPQWRMPDVLVNQPPPATVMYNRAGETIVYSKDGPRGSQLPVDLASSFSFKTFGADVKVSQRTCPGSGNPDIVTVIAGQTKVSLPGLGSDQNASSMLNSAFTLCSGKLREVNLTFHTDPGIPVAAPPSLWVNLLGGTITIDPAYTRVQVDIGFYIGAPALDPKQFKGIGSVIIDTRGLFDIQAKGRVMGLMDAEGHLWVAWNPLDTGVSVEGWLPSKDDWILHGFLYAHVWRGRGWQNRYAWLPDNDALHMTASFQADFRIKEGAIIDEWIIVLPPGDITLGVELSFGQFCANDSCSQTQWGVKGKLKILGYSVGVYINLECPELLVGVVFPPAVLLCTDFILGSDSHILIDQYGGGGPPFPLAASVSQTTLRIGGRDTVVNRRLVKDPLAAQTDEALPAVTSSTDSFLLAFGWARDTPHVALVRPDNLVIDQNNAVVNGVGISLTANSVLFGVSNPMQGTWQVRISNSTPTTDYHIMYFANKVTPQIHFIAPSVNQTVTASTNGLTSQAYHIQWTPPADSAHLRMSLFYSATNAGALTTTQQYGGVIAENIDPALGAYDWDISFLGTGDYGIYATLQDKVGANVTPTGTNQYVGVSTSAAPGVIHYADNTPPPAINSASIIFTPLDHGLLACWAVSASHDLAGYLLTYHKTDGYDGGPYGRTVTLRVLADVLYAPGAQQCTRINGLVPSITIISFTPTQGVAVYDASGNISTYVANGSAAVPVGADSGPVMPVISGTLNLDGSVSLAWQTFGYWIDVFYAREAVAGPTQPGTGAAEGDSPFQVDDISSINGVTIHGLTHGYWYDFAVRTSSQAAFASPGPLSNHVRLFLSDGVDSNGDGCPDDWQTRYNAWNLNIDPDGDGLTNRQECNLRTNPNQTDTDGDGWSDGAEAAYGTDPLDPANYPIISPNNYTTTVMLPTLAIDPGQLSFHAYTQGSNPAAQSVSVLNSGAKTLTPTLVSSSASWLKAQIVPGSAALGAPASIVVSVNKTGLTRGEYAGVITITVAPSNTQNNSQVVHVALHLLAGSPSIRKVFLPLVTKNFSGSVGIAPLVIYDDAPATGWSDWSYNATANLNNASPVHGGSKSIALTITGAYGALSLRSATPITTTGYSLITFWVYAPNTSRQLGFYTQGTDGGASSTLIPFTAPINAWTQFTMTLSALGNPAVIKRLAIQDESGATQPVMYVDDIVLN